LGASALAARDSYLVAAAGFALGGIAGVILFIALADDHGLQSLAWGLALNGAVAAALPAAALLVRGSRWPSGQLARLQIGHRLWRLLQGAAVPLAVQGLYVI